MCYRWKLTKSVRERVRSPGAAANAAPTQLPSKAKAETRDGIHRALKRGQTTFRAKQGERGGRVTPEAGKAKLMATRSSVVADWKATASVLRAQGNE